MPFRYVVLLGAGILTLPLMLPVMAQGTDRTNKQAAASVPKTGAAVVTANPKNKRTWAAGSDSGEGKTRTPQGTLQK